MNPHDETREEEQIASALAASESDAAPPDPELLARLRTQSTEAFATTATSARNRPIMIRAARWFAAAAAIAVISIGLYSWLVPGPSGVAFGKVLENTENADTLHVRISRGDQKIEFWHASKPNRSRWDDLNGNFRIADGAKYWIVNESANEARLVRSPWTEGHLTYHFLDLIGLPGVYDRPFEPQLDLIRSARPVERVNEGGHEVLVYRLDLKMLKGNAVLEARVIAESQRLLSIRSWVEKAGKREPLAELTVLAYDEPIAADKFAIADTLTEDGRIGKVTDVQGIVSIKPVLHDRWTPVREGLVLKPGDWVRTDARGANATALRLAKQTGVILGPKTLVELISPKQMRLIEGEVEIAAAAGTSIELLGPGPQKFAVEGRKLFRVSALWNPPPRHRDEPGRWQGPLLVQVDVEPSWLKGFKGATTNETLGSLVALVDGRNVPLTVGYHKVSVDIRDQIARTVIEESFVNRTDAVLEGVFYFPLPQDASISGFGMWIGDNLVEADVVEKQRAREIYETILRERRDPGLLEWSGGNIFKARVFPIPAHSEKRIKIVYTQVLPLKGNRYRYSYALQSEMLQQHPLRELSIDVKVNSVVPLKSVTSPTHPTRGELVSPRPTGGEGQGVRGSHSAHVEFTAQEYTPTRDFEVVVETEGKQAEVVMIPHRRGDDGYFMLQLTPPGSAGNWDRPILPNGDPVHLLILADTSASIDAGQRATQATFIGSLLAALTPKDTFNLAACDVTTDWAFTQAQSADEKSVTAARDFLAKRTSLGWTNLDVTFASALKQFGAKTHVIYVGDGIVTTGDADPVEFTKRLRRLWLPSPPGRGAGGEGEPRPTFHAVTLGSSYEPAVLKAIASLGGGSMRKITGEQGPTIIARELLGEIAQPALRDVKVEFKGIRAARVYPETLANVPAGSQQILLGRYLPDGKDQTGEIIVTGTQGGKPVRFSTAVSLKDAEQGNSFIPRLWARMHLDHLLEQGSSEAIKDEIITLSEDFQIITPYTSLLVLETNADRERFKVKRRFQMRDGERFFADGRGNAVFDLTQKQMKKASAWRTAIRRSVLSELARLGREPRLFQPGRHREYGRRLGDFVNLDAPPMDGISRLRFEPDGWMPLSELGIGEKLLMQSREEELGDIELQGKSSLDLFDDVAEKKSEWAKDKDVEDQKESGEPWNRLESPVVESLFARESDVEFYKTSGAIYSLGREYGGKFNGRGGRNVGAYYGQWLNTLFPPLHGAPGKAKEPKSTWPAAARELAKSLLRTDRLAKLEGGLEIARQTETFDVRWDGGLASRSRRLELVAAKSWLARSESDGGQTIVSWCDAKEIGIFSKAFQLGRVRAATPLDVQPPPLSLNDHSLSSLEQAYAVYTPTLEPQGKDRTLLVLKHSTSPHYETRILIDTARHVILSIEDRNKGKATGTTRFDDFVEAAGAWWARKIEVTNEAGKRQSLVTQTVKTLPANELDQQMKTELAGRASVQFLHLPMPSVASAKKALAAGKANFDDHFVLLMHFHASQQWPRVLDHLQQAEKLAAKPGMRWVYSALLHDSRRHEELRQRYLDDAARLAKESAADAYYLATYIVGQSASVLQANEMLALADVVQPLYVKQPAHVQARKHLQQLRASYVAQTGRTDEALKLQKQLATDYPRDYSLQQQYAQALAGAGDYPAAYAWLNRVFVKESKWLDWEEASLRTVYTGFLQHQGRYADLVTYLAAWVEQNPANRTTYEHYLSALVRADQIEKAEALALAWLKDAQVPGELSPPADARLTAAIQFMQGNIHQLYTNRIEERWLAPLAQAALFFARHETHASTAEQILSHQQFSNTEEAAKVRKSLAGTLSSEIGTLSPEQVRHLVGLLRTDDLAPAGWAKLTGVLRQRWANEVKDDIKHALGSAILSVLARQNIANEPLTFLRLQHRTGPEKYRTAYAGQLLDQLLAEPWQVEFEAEAFTLLDKLSDAEEPGARLFASVAALHRLTDTLYANRVTARTKTLVHPEKLTRTELLKKQEEFRKEAREGLADRLKKEAAKHPKALAQWLVAESLYLDLLLDRNLKQVAAEAWEFVGAAPPKQAVDEPTLERALDDVLRQRYLVTLMNLTARKGAEPALVERLLKYLDQGNGADDGRWKIAKSRMLIALDRSKDLEQALKQWTRQDDPDNQWRIALGYLFAEQGRVPEAIREFEAVEAADELTPTTYRSLADWYLVQNEREKHERAVAAIYKTMPEYQLSQRIAAKLHPWQQRDGHLPTVLDQEVLRMFNVLFEKSVSPQSYLSYLQQFYQASHDFRLLAGLPDAVLGHTAARVYPFVQGMQTILGEVRDEATADEIVKRIAEVRPRAKTDVDKRALDLLEAIVERRAAEVQDQPGPHVQKALAALVRASKGKWSPGEPRLMADFLASLSKISQQSLADEQLKQLKGLRLSESKRGSADSLHIAYRHALTLSNYQRRTEAIDMLHAELDEFQSSNAGPLPVSTNDALAALVGLLEDAGHFARAETVLVAQLKNPVHTQQRRWLIDQLGTLYFHALQKNGDVSLGKGVTLYQGLTGKIQKDLADPDPSHRYQLISLLCRVYQTGHEMKLPGVGADVKAFAFDALPPLLKDQTNHHDSIVSTVAQTVHDVAGPRDGIVFLLNQIDREPRWLRYNNQDGWSRHGRTLDVWRRESKNLGDVEARLLKLVLAELRRDLETQARRNGAMYHAQYHPPADKEDSLWTEKAGDFAKTAEAILAERSQSGPAIQYIADYFYMGLRQPKRAIDILFVAHNQKLLDETGLAKLVDYLHTHKRHGESIALLQPLVERRPANLDYRVWLMHAYFRTDRKTELLALLKDSDAFFHQKDRWTEYSMSRLANSTLQNDLFEQSVTYFKELIPLHESTAPNRGIGNGTLSGYYGSLASAYAGVKKTPEAVDAAGAAIVAWGNSHTNRKQALDALKDVLLRSPDLDAFVVHFDKRKPDQDSAVIRKALGQAYHAKKEYAKAIPQLEQAAVLQRNDAEIYQLLIASHDALGDKEGAVRVLLRAVQVSRRDLKLYQDLGKRYESTKQPHEAERAYTSIVEMLPAEAESHALLAEVREKQNRWPEAIGHWEQVARLRALEPTGLLKLAAAQIHEKQWDRARETLRRLDVRTWPPRFSDVRAEIRKLEGQLK